MMSDRYVFFHWFGLFWVFFFFFFFFSLGSVNLGIEKKKKLYRVTGMGPTNSVKNIE